MTRARRFGKLVRMSNDLDGFVPGGQAFPPTRTTLLKAATPRNDGEPPDETAVRTFVDVYRAALGHFVEFKSGQKGWSDKDDVVLDVLREVLAALPGFERRREGSFRAYLKRVAVHRLTDARRSEKARERHAREAMDALPGFGNAVAAKGIAAANDGKNPGHAAPSGPSAFAAGSGTDLDDAWDLLLSAAALARAFRTAKGLSAKAASMFLHVFRGEEPKEVAAKFMVGVSQVSNNKERVSASANAALAEAVEAARRAVRKAGGTPGDDPEGVLLALFDDRPRFRAALEARLETFDDPDAVLDFVEKLQDAMQARWGATHLGPTRLADLTATEGAPS